MIMGDVKLKMWVLARNSCRGVYAMWSMQMTEGYPSGAGTNPIFHQRRVTFFYR